MLFEFTGHDNVMLQRQSVCTKFSDPAIHVIFAVSGSRQDSPGTRAFQEVTQLGQACARTDPHGGQARLLATYEGGVNSGSIGKHDRQPVATPKAHGVQHSCESLRTRVVGGPGHGVVRGNNRRRIGLATCVVADDVGQ